MHKQHPSTPDTTTTSGKTVSVVYGIVIPSNHKDTCHTAQGNKHKTLVTLPVRVRVAGGSIGWESREARKNWRKKVGKAKIGGGKIGEENWERELGIGHDKMHESRRSHCRGLDRTRYTTIGVVNTVTLSPTFNFSIVLDATRAYVSLTAGAMIGGCPGRGQDDFRVPMWRR